MKYKLLAYGIMASLGYITSAASLAYNASERAELEKKAVMQAEPENHNLESLLVAGAGAVVCGAGIYRLRKEANEE